MTFRKFLMPFDVIYGFAVGVRNVLYDRRILKSKRLNKPVISVGNINVGGSGKTPFVLFLVDKLINAGFKPAVLSRGYKRFTEDLIVTCPAIGMTADVQLTGDEPALISMRFPSVPVAVHRDRFLSGSYLLKSEEVDVFVLDDGFQDRELYRDFDFVLTDYSLSDLTERYLPSGNLRDSRRRLKDADVIVLTSHSRFSIADVDSEELSKLEDARVCGVSFVPEVIVDFSGREHHFYEFNDKKVVAFCGIAKPESFFKSLRLIGIIPASTFEFSDHHWYDDYDIDEIFKGEEDVLALTTEKDAVRIYMNEELSVREEVKRLYALRERCVVNFGGEEIDNLISKVRSKSDA
ncbi:MAG: tetraacyldisaccharide 4'-kinase [Candidatus Kryptoniota bacterium]